MGALIFMARKLLDILLTFYSNTLQLLEKLLSSQYNIKAKRYEVQRIRKTREQAGCYNTGRQQQGHPLWFSPKTGMYFQMSNHGTHEVATGTLKKIKRAAGI